MLFCELVRRVVNWACVTLFWPPASESQLKIIAVPRPSWRFPDGLLEQNSATFHETLLVFGAFLWTNNGGLVPDIIDDWPSDENPETFRADSVPRLVKLEFITPEPKVLLVKTDEPFIR